MAHSALYFFFKLIGMKSKIKFCRNTGIRYVSIDTRPTMVKTPRYGFAITLMTIALKQVSAELSNGETTYSLAKEMAVSTYAAILVGSIL